MPSFESLRVSKSIQIVFSALLIFTAWTLYPPSAFAQGVPEGTDAGAGYCSLHGNYKGPSCPKCNSSGSSSATDSSVAAVDPRQLALQNALPRYNALVHSLSDRYNLVDEKSWLDFPKGTEAEFFDGANQMHKLLVNRAAGIHFREGKVTEELGYLNEVIETYPGLIAKLHTDNGRKRLESNRLTSALEYGKQQLELTQRAAKQLETRAYRYEQDVKQNKETILNWFAILLPPSVVKTVSPIAYESIMEPLVGSVPVRQRIPETVTWSKSEVPIQLRPSKYGTRLESDPKPLSGTAEDRVAQLESDAKAYGSAFSRTPMINEAVKEGNRKRPIAEQLGEEQRNAIDERDTLDGEIQTFGGQLTATAWALVVARDTLQAAQETFLYRAADAWIWENAKSEAVNQVKNEVRRLVAEKTTGVNYQDMTDVKMREFFSAGERNIFGLTEKISSFGEGLDEILDRFNTLRTHALGYAQESVRVAALGSPREMIAFVAGMSEGMDADSEQLVKANLSAIDIPEPWQSISAKYFLKRPE